MIELKGEDWYTTQLDVLFPGKKKPTRDQVEAILKIGSYIGYLEDRLIEAGVAMEKPIESGASTH